MCAKILVVDDEQPLVELLTANLQREGYEVISAGDGVTALELAESQKPDLILLDWMLPKLDGFEVCKRLRPKTAAPIIMVTAKGEEISSDLPLLDSDEINKDDGGSFTGAFVYYYVLEYPDGTYRFAVLIRDT